MLKRRLHFALPEAAIGSGFLPAQHHTIVFDPEGGIARSAIVGTSRERRTAGTRYAEGFSRPACTWSIMPAR